MVLFTVCFEYITKCLRDDSLLMMWLVLLYGVVHRIPYLSSLARGERGARVGNFGYGKIRVRAVVLDRSDGR